MHQPVAEGGINFINFNFVVKSLRLAWISRLLGDTDDKWKAIPSYYFLLHDGKHARHASELNRLYSTSLLPTAHNNINVTRVQSSNTFPPVKFTILRSATLR